jgi:ubiquinone biosynthesis protein Coq4
VSFLSKLFLIKKLYSQGRAGDIGILKLDLFRLKGSAFWEDSVNQLPEIYPPIILEELKKCPKNSLGLELYSFMLKSNITPFKISKEYQHLIAKNAFGVRMLAMHDIYHVLLGFNTTYAGEMGVWAFQRHKKFSTGITISYFAAKILYPIFSPKSFKEILAQNGKGRRLARESILDICFVYQDHWNQDISEIRKKLNIIL